MSTQKKRLPALLAGLLLLVGVTACGNTGPSQITPPNQNSGGAAGGEGNTYDHPDIVPNLDELLGQLAKEGPPSYAARVHACQKMRYENLGRLLASRGVNMNDNAELAAANLYRQGSQALGVPRYEARVRESTLITTAGAAKLYDILAQAAPEIIAAMPNIQECAVGGVPTEMFDGQGRCTARGIACITGMPATDAQLDLCNLVVARASTPEKGRTMAVAAIAAAAHTCE